MLWKCLKNVIKFILTREKITEKLCKTNSFFVDNIFIEFIFNIKPQNQK